jgi:hypothetical protein
VLTVDLRTHTFVKTPPGTKEHSRIDYEVLDLGNEVTAYLEELVQARKGDKGAEQHIGGDETQLGTHLVFFVLARACAANGLDDLAYEAYKMAWTIRHEYTDQSDSRSFQEIVEDELAYTIMWRNVLSFGDASISRQELLDGFERFAESFPESEYATRARETAVLLRQMVKEDEEHIKQTESLETMPLDERIAELIFQLRDQNGHQWSQPGCCDIFSDERGKNSPAHQLVSIGYPAVPQLIAVLDDERFTRSVGFHRDFYFSHHVLRVGDAAFAIIGRIAGSGFCARYATSSEMVKDGEPVSVKAVAEIWWQDLQKKGEEQMLIEAVELGDRSSPPQACLLATRYPNTALEAITSGIRNAKGWWVHKELVAIAAGLEGDGPVPLLLSVVKRGPYLSSRLAAAVGLHRRGRPEGVAAMIREWSEPGEVDPAEFRAQEHLAEFLATCDDPEALRALSKGLHKHPVDIRSEVILALTWRRIIGYDRFRVGNSRCVGTMSSPENTRESPEAATAIEDLLVYALDDTGEDIGTSWFDDRSLPSPRVCDLAGHELAQRWPDRYDFNHEAPLVERNRMLVELKNVWRRDKGLAPLPLPQRPEIPSVPDEIVRPLLEHIVQSPTSKDREAINGLEDLGLKALPAVRALLDDMDEEHPARPVIIELAVHLANTVREVTIDPDSVEPDHLLVEQIENLKERSLTPKRIADLLLAATQRLPPDATGVELHVDRMSDGTGIVLSVRLTRPTISERSLNTGWTYTIFMATDNRSLLHVRGSMGYAFDMTNERTYEGFVKTLEPILQVPPEETLRLRLSITRQH